MKKTQSQTRKKSKEPAQLSLGNDTPNGLPTNSTPLMAKTHVVSPSAHDINPKRKFVTRKEPQYIRPQTANQSGKQKKLL